MRVKMTWKWRRPKVWNVASANGLQYSRKDPFGLVDMTVDFFRRGDLPKFHNVVWGSWQGFPSIEADVQYTGALGAMRGPSLGSLAIVGLDAGLPQVRISPSVGTLAEHIGSRTVSFESQEFNDRYHVTADDREGAFELVDARMMRWMLSMPRGLGFETNGTTYVVCSPGFLTGTLMTLLEAAKGFSEHIPRVAWAQPGPAASAEFRGPPHRTHVRALVESSPTDVPSKHSYGGPGAGPAAAPDPGSVFEAPTSS